MTASIRVGVLGGGQLSRFLCDAARRLGLESRILCASREEPAARAADHVVLGSDRDLASVESFARDCDVILFENEFVPAPVLEGLKAFGNRVQPPPAAIAEVQNKARQKRLFERCGIASPAFVECAAGETAAAFVERVWARFGDRFVLKWAELGYDGKGTHLTKDRAGAAAFAEAAIRERRPLFAEARVDFRREVALVASRSRRGDLATWPLVVTHQENGTCREVLGPARTLGIPESAERELHLWAERIGETAGLVGTFALEIFEDADGKFWMNEIAPRVHNSGHWSLDGAVTSQFENHLRACLGLPLGRTEALYPAFVMRNLLGPTGVSRKEPLPHPQVEAAQVSLYWYGKGEVRPGRKMGHLNGVSPVAGELEELRRRLERIDAQWIAELRTEK